MNFETPDFEMRRKYRGALKAYREVKLAVDHLESDHFHESPDADRKKILNNYSSKLKIWGGQIPEELHPRIHCLNRLQMYVSD